MEGEGEGLPGSHRLWQLPQIPLRQRGALAQSKTKHPEKKPFAKGELKVLGSQMVRKWVRAVPRAGPSQHAGNPLEVTARKLPYTAWKDDSRAHAPGWGLPINRSTHP